VPASSSSALSSSFSADVWEEMLHNASNASVKFRRGFSLGLTSTFAADDVVDEGFTKDAVVANTTDVMIDIGSFDAMELSFIASIGGLSPKARQ
jgi:hypothetical protein